MATDTMTSKEIVRRALHFQRPPRLPALMGSLGVSDVAGTWLWGSAAFRERPRPASLREGEREDEWGCVWGQTHVPNMGQVINCPLEDIRKLDKHPMPDYTDPTHFGGWEEATANGRLQGKYMSTGIFMVLFERMHTLHGFENTLMDLYADRPAMEALADRITDVHVTLVREVAKRFPGRFDGWTMTDDWGTQQAAFISIDLWMDFFLLRYKRIFDAMHAAGCDVWVHSCGKINEIIEGYIAEGVNTVSPLQPRALGIEEIGRRYGGRIAFDSLADIQTTLPSGDRAMVEKDVTDLMTHWARPEGGFILCDYGADEAIGVKDPSLKRYMYDLFSQCSERLYGQPLPPPVPPQPSAVK
jgi:uroporphyrinogen decarboxylase